MGTLHTGPEAGKENDGDLRNIKPPQKVDIEFATLSLKLKDGVFADESARERVVVEIASTPGVKGIKQTFPNNPDAEVASLYLLSVERAEVPSIMQKLEAHQGIEFIEVSPLRWLV